MNAQELSCQIDEFLEEYPLFQVSQCGETTVLNGAFELNVEVRGIPLCGDFDIKIEIPPGYPEELPKLYELSNLIPDSFEHKYDDGSCCLGVDGELYQRFIPNPTLLHYVKDMVADYFASVKWFIRYGDYPFGQRSHGTKGVFEFYRQFWDVDNDQLAARMLCIALVPGTYRGHQPCPCGSGKIARKCHSSSFQKIFALPSKHYLIKDCKEMLYKIKHN